METIEKKIENREMILEILYEDLITQRFEPDTEDFTILLEHFLTVKKEIEFLKDLLK